MARKKMKVLIVLSISCTLLLSQAAMAETTISATSATPAVAAQQVQSNQEELKTKISKDEAIKIIKAFDFTQGYDMSNISLDNNSGRSEPVWRMDLNTAQYFSQCSVSISANTGELLDYYSYQQQYLRKNIVTINKKKAKEIADKFISDYIKTDSKSLEFVPNQNNLYEKTAGVYEIPQYDFTYALKVNGIITSNVNYNISINAANGEVTRFSSPYQFMKETKYPSTDGVKDLEQLKNKYISLLDMQLQYITTYDNNKEKVILVYVPTTPGMLNAKTMATEDSNDYYGYGLSKTAKYAPIIPDAKVENKAITEENALVIINNAKAYIENLVGLKFGDNQNISVRMDTTNKEISRYYRIMEGNKNYGLSISLNLNTGNITNLSLYQYYMGIAGNNENQKVVTEKVNYKDAKKTSDEIIKNLFVKQYGVFSDNNKEPDSSKEFIKQQQSHNFLYTRYENGVLTSNSINVSIDKETGKLSQVNIYWNDLDYPEIDKVVSAEAAKEAYLKDAEFGLEYYTPYFINNGNMDAAGESVIVYKPKTNTIYQYIDANTGKLVDYTGQTMQAPYVNEKHWAANSIEMLEAQGVLIKNISSYDEKLSKQDAVKMLSQIMGTQYFNAESQKTNSFSDINKENEYYKYIECAVQNGIINATGKSFNGTTKITKGEFIGMLIDMLGYKEIIKHDELFSKSDGNTYISICKALDILPVKTGDKFNPEDNITFAEAAYSLQKSLKYYR